MQPSDSLSLALLLLLRQTFMDVTAHPVPESASGPDTVWPSFLISFHSQQAEGQMSCSGGGLGKRRLTLQAKYLGVQAQ